MNQCILTIITLLIVGIPVSSLADDSMSIAAIKQRIAPVGQVYLEGQKTVQSSAAHPTSRSGQEIYDSTCYVCHGTGAVNSPKVGDKEVWKPRIKAGMKMLLIHAINGYNFMPPRGTCEDCTVEEIKSAIEYMIDRSK